MGENFDFDAMFANLAKDNAELAAVAEDIAAEVQAAPAKDGLAYAGDVEGANGHAISVYRMTVTGKHVFDVLIDNFVEVPVPAKLGTVPAGITAHTIVIAKPGQASGITTTGLAFRAPHPSGVHIEGKALQAYIYPRAVRFLVQLYVV